MNKFLRGLIVFVALALIGAVCLMCLASAQEPPKSAATSFQISGSVRNGKVLLPGVTVTAANTLTGKKYSAVTATNGTFQFSGLPRGRYVVRMEFMGFATATQEVVLNPESPTGKVEAELILASRQEEQQADTATQTARRGFQSLAVNKTLSALAGEGVAGGSNGNGGNLGDASGLPLNGAGADSPTESVDFKGRISGWATSVQRTSRQPPVNPPASPYAPRNRFARCHAMCTGFGQYAGFAGSRIFCPWYSRSSL